MASLQHSHTKRNSLDIRAIFMEFWEYVNNGGVVVYWVERNFFEELQAGDGIEGILAFSDKNTDSDYDRRTI